MIRTVVVVAVVVKVLGVIEIVEGNTVVGVGERDSNNSNTETATIAAREQSNIGGKLFLNTISGLLIVVPQTLC